LRDVTDVIREMRGAVYRGDGARVVALLAEAPDEDWLQLAGDGVLQALDQGVAAAPEAARGMVEALRARDWPGDEELAVELGARIGDGPPSGLRPLPVELDELASVLEGDPMRGGGRIDLRSGEVWHEPVYGDPWEADEDDDEEHWLYVDCEGSSEGYRDMEDFIATVRDRQLAGRLDVAIRGRGAFRRFRDVLDEAEDDDDRERWLRFSDERSAGRARAWLAERGLCPAPAGDRP
jgi:hypothetical protein